ncbi:hypothetical protein, partial [Vibrio alginolyticus]|uniref:hypothetical protein n=1 Tax=Vibrio alginolyticus TaxID=663 RepID=UPI001A8FB945
TTSGYLGFPFLSQLNYDLRIIRNAMNNLMQLQFEEFIAQAVSWLHTIHGRLIPVLAFMFTVKILTGVAFITLALVSVLISIISA